MFTPHAWIGLPLALPFPSTGSSHHCHHKHQEERISAWKNGDLAVSLHGLDDDRKRSLAGANVANETGEVAPGVNMKLLRM